MVQERWNYVLDNMVEEGWLDASKRAEMKFPTPKEPKAESGLKGQKGYFVKLAKIAKSVASYPLHRWREALKALITGAGGFVGPLLGAILATSLGFRSTFVAAGALLIWLTWTGRFVPGEASWYSALVVTRGTSVPVTRPT